MKIVDIYISNTKTIKADFTNTAGRSGSSVSSVEWLVEDGAAVTLGAPSLTVGVATIPIVSTGSSGCSIVRAKATLADGQVLSKYFKVNVIDPTC